MKNSMSKTSDGSMNNGYAFVEFSNPEECKYAVQFCKREAFRGQKLVATPLPLLLRSTDEDVFLGVIVNIRYLHT